MATKDQIRQIYGLGAVCELLDSSRGVDDELHLWVRQFVPNKLHISDLSEKQADFIIERLKDYAKHMKELKAADVMSDGQKSKAFRLMYILAELSPSPVSVRDRLAGVIGQITGREIQPRADIFARLSEREGSAVIETLKRYISNEERKRKRGERDGNVKSGGAPPP